MAFLQYTYNHILPIKIHLHIILQTGIIDSSLVSSITWRNAKFCKNAHHEEICRIPEIFFYVAFFALIFITIIYHLICWFFFTFSHTVPSVDSSIPVTIQPVVIGNMVEITVLVNVSNNEIICILYKLYTFIFVCVV